jgi:hypothetical protein
VTTIVHLLPHFDNDGNGIVNIVVDLACAHEQTFSESVGMSQRCLAMQGFIVNGKGFLTYSFNA